MSERTLVDYVLEGMRGRWELPVKHADGFTLGISDLSAWIAPAGNVFIELKDAPHWPARGTTPLDVDYTEEQHLFTRKRRGWVFLRVEREYFLFDHHHACVLTGDFTERDVRTGASAKWERSVEWENFARLIAISVR